VVLLTFPLAVLPFVLAVGAPLPGAVLAAFVGGVAIDILVVLWDTTMQREIPAEALSRVSSYDALGTLLLGPVGLLLAGPSVDVIGSRNALLISAGVTVLASIGALCSPGVRRLQWSTKDTVEGSKRDRNQPSQLAPSATSTVAPALIDA
jgi:MFS family permease